MNESYQVRQALRPQLSAILRRTIVLQVAAGMVSALAGVAWLIVLLVVWSAAVPEPTRWTSLVISRGTILLVMTAIGYFVLWPVVRLPRLERLAAEVEKREDLRELLRAGYEFSTDPGVARRYSPSLVGEVIRRAVDATGRLRVRSLFLSRRDTTLVPVAFGGLAVLTVLAIVRPALLVETTRRIADPGRVATMEHRANLRVTPGDVTVLAGSDLDVEALDFGSSPHPVALTYNLAGDFWKTEPTRRIARASNENFDRYQFKFHDLRRSLSYYFAAGGEKTTACHITVVHRPILTDVGVTLTPPAYTGAQKAEIDDDGGNVQALEGTGVRVDGISNNPIVGAWVRFDDGDPKEIEHDGRSVRFEFEALADGHYVVILEDSLGHRTVDPLVYSVEVYQDNAPSLDVVEPGGDATLPRNQRLNVGFVASDDYGIARSAIYYREGGQGDYRRLSVSMGKQRGRKEVVLEYEWDLKAISLFPGDYIEYYVAVADNNVVTGPGVAKSKVYQISVPTMAQLYEDIQEEDSIRGDLFDEAMRDSEDLRDRLEKLSREYLKTEKMEWSQKKEVDKAIEKQEAVEEKLQQIKDSLDRTMQQLSDNKMTSQRIGEELEEIRELMDQIDSRELSEHMERLKESIEQMRPEDIKEALKNVDISAEEMLEKLERTAELLKQLQREQNMEEIVRKSSDLMQEQKTLSDETNQSDVANKKEISDLAERQESMAKETEALKRDIEAFEKEMESVDPEVASELAQVAAQMNEKSGPQGNMRQASRDLKGGKKSSAQDQQRKATEKMISLFRRASRAQQAMQSNNGSRTAMNLEKFARQTLELSFKQEALARRLRDQRTANENADLHGFMQNQNSYLKATEKISDEIVRLSRQTLAINPRLMQMLGKTLERMRNSVLFLDQNKPFMSTAHAENAVQSLNEATIEMLSSAQQCSSSQGSGGSQSLVQQLMQQLIPQQQTLAQQTRSLLEMKALEDKLRHQRQAELERLAGQQRSLGDLAEQIQESLKDNRDILGRLDKTIEEMEGVARSLESGDLNREVVDRQERILSRLLDAQRSVHTRDYEKKRESATAGDFFSKGVGGRGGGRALQRLRDRIRRAMQLKAPGEFEDLIRMYFRALAEDATVTVPETSNAAPEPGPATGEAGQGGR